MSTERITDLLSRDDIRAFTARSNLAGAWAIASTWLVIAATLAALAAWPGPLAFVAAVIVLGGRQLALAVAMHEGAHGTLFTRPWANHVVVDWLCARPVWSDTARYRRHHLAHHAHTGTARDPDLALAPERPMTRGSLVRKLARDLAGITGVRRLIGLVMIDAELLAFDVSGAVRRAPRRSAGHHLRALARNAWRPIAANLVLAGVLAATGHAWLYLAWAVAYLTMFSLVIRVRSLAEHACMTRTADELRNTRSTAAGWLARTTFAPLHVNYHLEHHLLPTVPYHRLPALHRVLERRDAIPPGSRARGYLDVLRIVSARKPPNTVDGPRFQKHSGRGKPASASSASSVASE
ncbi:MAG TPA: fatty acid desaturase family protein [Kofleriaceae bacterium]|nr:fatty acid desaturase family protein [Kofleriaceae bacterium]